LSLFTSDCLNLSLQKKVVRLKIFVGLTFLLVFRFSVSSQIVYQHNFGTTAISGSPYNVSPSILNSNLSTNGWTTNVSGGFVNFFGSGGNPSVALSLSNSSGTPSYTLSLTVNSGYQLDISSLSFWRQRSNTGATNFSVSINGGSSVSTGTIPATGSNTGTLSVSGYSSLTGNVSIVISLSGASGAGTFRLDDFTIAGLLTPIVSCTSPVSLSFQTQPTNILQDANMSPSVQVAVVCSDGTVATGYTGNVTLTVNASGCGYTTQTVSFVNGVGTFNSIVFTRSPQSNLTFTATSSGLTSATSTPFNVNSPAGAPSVFTIIENNFDAIQDWGYSVGTAISVGSGGSAGTDVVGIVTEAGTGVLRKSFSVNNSSGDLGSKNTITFNNVTGLSTYSNIDFTFNVLSFGSGSGPGNDSGEDFSLDVSTDNGATWTSVLFQYGFNNRLFPQSASPITSLSLSSITYAPPAASSGPDTRSAFLLTLTGISQFCFRFTAQNNRSEENWAIDNPKLIGTTYGVGAPFNLPTVNLGNDIQFCSGNSVQLSSTVTSVLNPVTYSWNPSTWLNNATISNPTVTGLTSSQTYTLTVTDADNCSGMDQVTVSPLFPPAIIFLSPP
jgi:hypothetical protein